MLAAATSGRFHFGVGAEMLRLGNHCHPSGLQIPLSFCLIFEFFFVFDGKNKFPNFFGRKSVQTKQFSTRHNHIGEAVWAGLAGGAGDSPPRSACIIISC